MATYLELMQEVKDTPPGPQIGALFDFDGTLMAGFSAVAFMKEQVKQKRMSARDFAEMIKIITRFSLGKIGFSGMMNASSMLMQGTSEEEYAEFGRDVYEKQIARLIYAESRELVKAHLKKGHTVAIISSAMRYQILPAAEELGIETVLCTEMVVRDGNFTGELIKPLCWGEGKVVAAEKLVDAFGVDLEQSFFYSDSDDDLQLLERVGFPKPLNPNTKLTAIAEDNNWPIQRFESRPKPTAKDLLRSVAADLSMVPVLLLSLPIWSLTGSKRQAQNFAGSLYSELAGALAGLTLEVNGEHHLWEQRPAIFVFNHQSKVDGIIMPKLLHKDFAGVGKKEIAPIPIFAKLIEFGGTVLIDRKNSAGAIAAMQPLVDELTVNRKSVMIAPEGTRTSSPNLASFKKGAFHLAIQAGVPMVPVVIHNALDIAAKGDIVYRKGSVKVDVLPPVDTSAWTVETLNDHVRVVRNMFLSTLGQELEPELAGSAASKKPVSRQKKPVTKKKAPAKKSSPVRKKSTSVRKKAATGKRPGKAG